jgi:hypothetical protein
VSGCLSTHSLPFILFRLRFYALLHAYTSTFAFFSSLDESEREKGIGISGKDWCAGDLLEWMTYIDRLKTRSHFDNVEILTKQLFKFPYSTYSKTFLSEQGFGPTERFLLDMHLQAPNLNTIFTVPIANITSLQRTHVICLFFLSVHHFWLMR